MKVSSYVPFSIDDNAAATATVASEELPLTVSPEERGAGSPTGGTTSNTPPTAAESGAEWTDNHGDDFLKGVAKKPDMNMNDSIGKGGEGMLPFIAELPK